MWLDVDLRAPSHMRLWARDHSNSSTLIGGKGGAGSSFLPTTVEGPTEWACECGMDVKSTWIPTWHPMDHVSWSLGLFSRNHLLEVGLTQNWETMALWTLTTVDLFYINMCEDSHKYTFIEIAFGWGPGHVWLHTTLEGRWPHYMILEVSWDGLWTLSFGLLQLSWSRLLALNRKIPYCAQTCLQMSHFELPRGMIKSIVIG